MPVVSPVDSSSKVFAVVQRQVVDVDLHAPVLAGSASTASARMVRLMRPRKSNFSRPSASQACISNWVMVVRPSVARWSGMISVSGSRLMTIPAAWVEAWRATPSSCLAIADQLVHPLVAGDQLAQLRRRLDRPLQADVQLVGHRLGDPIRLGVGQAHGPPDVADGGLGAQRPEGDDLRHPVVAVLAGDVLDHLVPRGCPGSRCRCPASSPGPGSGSARTGSP